MIPSDRMLAISFKLPIVNMVPSAAVWLQFSMEVSSYKWPYLGNGER